MNDKSTYDVCIIGAGMAGITLALQLIKQDSQLNILIVERRNNPAPDAIHKVGESSSELGAIYLREILELKQYMEENHYPKFGFRFFFDQQKAMDISRRVEVGSRISNPYPTHHIDRGRFENDMIEYLRDLGVKVLLNTSLLAFESANPHMLRISDFSGNREIHSRWVVDCTGRSSHLRKKLNLSKAVDHHINSVWFRIKMEVDIEDWSTSDDWKNLFYKGSRKFATNHLMGNGYWIWIIPLVSGSTSIGIVADPRILPFEKINSLHKCLSWMKEEEPLLHSRLISHPDKILDFKMMKDFALDSVHYYSKDRWALSGEAASFTDAFYSPGLDFIALGNTWISSLILSDSKGMDIYAQSMIYELMHKRLFSGWLTLYQDQYSALGNTALMLMKVIWDWSAYWSIQCLMFKNHGYTDVGIIKEFSSQNDQLGQRFAILNQSMQNLFKDWNQEAAFSFAGISHNVFDLGFMKKFQEELHLSIPKTELISKLKANIEILEKIAVSIYCLVYERYKHKLNENRINPYEMQLNDSIDQIVQKSHSVSAILPDSVILEDVRRFWLYENSSPAASHV